MIHVKFQSHLRLIHPIHLPDKKRIVRRTLRFNRICASSTLSTTEVQASNASIYRGFNRICASSTLSTWSSTVLYLMPIVCFNRICASSTLSTRQGSDSSFSPSNVSIASAPHPPYPPKCMISLFVVSFGFNRICASSTLSTRGKKRDL